MLSRLEPTSTASQATPSPVIARREWQIAAGIALFVVLLIGVPYVIGAWSSTSDRIFTGFLVGRIGLEDDSSYLGKMMQGAHGLWLGFLPHAGVPHSGTLFFLFYRLLGWLCQTLLISPVVGFHIARLALAFSFVLVLYRFIAEFVTSPRARLLALMLITLAGGTGWLSIFFGLNAATVDPPLEIVSPESYTFWMLYTTPHLIAAEILLLCGVWLVWRAGATGRWRPALLGGLCWLGMVVLQPVFTAVAAALAVFMVVGRSLAQRRLVWQQAGAGLLATILASPMIVYSLSVFAVDPVYAYWANSQITMSGSPASFVWSYAVLLLLSIPGVIAAWKQRRDAGWMFLLVWFLLQPALLYAPTSAQRRLIVGWQIPLSILIAYGLTTYTPLFLARQFPRHGRRLWRAVVGGVVTLTTLTFGMLLLWNLASVANRQPEYFYSSDQLIVAHWLETHATYADGVLASFSTSTFLPAYADVRVHAGHHNETAWVDDRKTEIQKFFRADTSDEWRRELLQRYGMTYVFYGPDERVLGDFDPTHSPYLTPEFESGAIRLYQVMP
jgi:hypothetical protein